MGRFTHLAENLKWHSLVNSTSECTFVRVIFCLQYRPENVNIGRGGDDRGARSKTENRKNVPKVAPDFIDQIDSFYKDSANLNIPVIEACRYVIRTLQGAVPAELSAMTADLRGRYNK